VTVVISVVIPCHNAERWIGTALQSVSGQTRQADEIIVIDDGSTDRSILEIEKADVPTKLLRVNFANAAASRNAGIQVATGDWIALLDADDVWYPNHLARAVELLRPTNDVAFMSSHDWIDLDGGVIPIPEAHRCKLPAPQTGMTIDDYYQLNETGFHFGHSTVLYRRDRVIEVGGFDTAQKRRHDIDLWLRVIADGTWTYDTVKSVGYRENTPGSISRDEMDCDYYYLRALIKNLNRIDSPRHRKHLARQSRRAMGIAFVAATPEDYARIRELSWPYLSWFFKFFYSCGSFYPDVLRSLIKAKRRIVHMVRTVRLANNG
jgi:glycosyltransferase involved in cell wall biosynthesis